VVESYGGRVIFSSGQVVFSSSRLAASMTPWDDLATQRMCLICRRHGIDESALSGFFDRIAGCRVLVFGDLVVDRYVLCDAGGIAGESPMMSLKSLDQRDYLGGAAAMADQAAALGAEPVLYTAMADDEISRWARTTLESRGTEVRVIHRRPDLPIRTRFLVDDQKLFKVERTASRPLDSVGERQAAARLAEQANRADAIIFYDSGFGMITPWILGQLDAAWREAAPGVTGGITDAQGNLAAMKRLDLLCTSERRLRAAMNDLDSGLSTLAYRMLDVTQAGRMLVTLGKRGLVTFERPSSDRASPEWRGRLLSEYLPTFAHRVVDRLGCGQALMTTATLSSAVGAGLMQGAYLGSLAAAVQLGRLGPDAVSAGDMRQLMRQRAELASTAEADSHSVRRDALAPARTTGSCAMDEASVSVWE
jgi:bifunctional ADP-heptose synthase (sugar kinase/adenylyltransferase)